MGRKLVKKRKYNFAMYENMIDAYMAAGLSEEDATKKVDMELFNSVQYELDENDEMCRAIMTGGVPRMMLDKALESDEGGGNDD